MCCGQKRRALADGAMSQPAQPPMVGLLYLEHSPLQIRGAVTGRLYYFSGSRRAQDVDPRDVSALLRTRLFRPTRAA